MDLTYTSTRGHGETVTASQAILKGLADDGGLFVPTSIPVLDVPMDKLAEMSYGEVAYEVMKLFFSDFTEEELKAYNHDDELVIACSYNFILCFTKSA